MSRPSPIGSESASLQSANSSSTLPALRVATAVGLAACLCGCQFMPGTSAYNEEKAKRTTAELLIDPSSAQFRNVVSRDNAVCGEVNGKNRMGGYVGYSRFYVDTVAWSAQLDPGFDYNELMAAEESCTSAQSNSYVSASATASACDRAREQRAAQILQAYFDRGWAAKCGTVTARSVYRPPLGEGADDTALVNDTSLEEPEIAFPADQSIGATVEPSELATDAMNAADAGYEDEAVLEEDANGTEGD